MYLPWLKSQLESRSVTFIQKRLRNIEEAAELAGPDGIVVNALSMGVYASAISCRRLTTVL